MAQQKQQSTWSSIREFIVLIIIVFLIRTIGFGLYQVPTGSMEHTMLVGERFFADKLSYVFRAPRHGEIISMNAPDYPYSKNSLKNFFERYVWGPSNWTKRVIGIPGDTIRGVIEDGKPVVYRNGQKLDESYVNKYPLISVLPNDPKDIYREVESQAAQSGYFVDRVELKKFVDENLEDYALRLSYDPSMPYDKQPFYRVEKDRIIFDKGTGNPKLRHSGTPHYGRGGKSSVEEAKNYWDGSDVFQVTLGDDEYWCMGDNRLNSKDSRYFGPFRGYQIHGRIIFLIWSSDSNESWWIVDLIKHPIDFWNRLRIDRCLKWLN